MRLRCGPDLLAALHDHEVVEPKLPELSYALQAMSDRSHDGVAIDEVGRECREMVSDRLAMDVHVVAARERRLNIQVAGSCRRDVMPFNDRVPRERCQPSRNRERTGLVDIVGHGDYDVRAQLYSVEWTMSSGKSRASLVACPGQP